MSDWKPVFSERWRHGGWYVSNIRYPSGANGCVTNNVKGGWAVACPWDQESTDRRFATREEAARFEHDHVLGLS